jgi:predicted NUDIX family NTP pyrophosphohydrolase
MPKRATVSAGLLLFRRASDGIEVFLAHPGGPFWRQRDAGAWTIPKGVVNEGEELLVAARREFQEETGVRAEGPFLPLGYVRQRSGKHVHAWAWEGDADPALATSNTMRCEWPRGKLLTAQAELLDRLVAVLTARDTTDVRSA